MTDSRLQDVLTGGEDNHLLPFLWMHDGHHDELPDLVRQVWESGARALCVESRPHEQFCRQGWWDDMDVVLREAEKRGMQVWILDDKHFPTGYANGLIAEKYPQRRKWQLVEEHVDLVGPAPEHAFLLHPDEENILLGVFAYPRPSEAEILSPEPVDLTDRVKGKYVYWDVPEGVWRIVALYKTRRGTKQTDYIHLIDPDSVDILIEAVYEPHYAHYSRYFGNVIAGFFSDEPSLGNVQTVGSAGDVSMYNQRLGQPGLALPWTDELLRAFSERLGEDARKWLPGLWYEMGEITPRVRYAYMDALTCLWRKHFSYKLGEWCRRHGVEYIGHIIEDKNAHARLGCSAGHYFRALDGQDMAGIDVVLHQIMPGLAHYQHAMISATGVSDPEFFQYVLARLAASHSHIQPRMRDRAMCEVFGAYGWAEGVPFMRKLMDHMLVRGINYFVPHAFSPKYPDPDCPPHFNGGGDNPEAEPFSRLMRYTNQVAHLLEGGREVVSAAILYHGEAEWSGRPYMLSQKPARRLLDAQLNYDIVPIDAVMAATLGDDGSLRVSGMSYPVLIVPGSAWLPPEFGEKLASLDRQGARIAFVDERPADIGAGRIVALDEVAEYVRETAGADVRLEKPFDLLRYIHVRRGGVDVFMFVNESLSEDFDGDILLPVTGWGTKLDLLSDGMTAVRADGDGALRLSLARGASTVLLFGDDSWKDAPDPVRESRHETLNGPWTLTLRAAHDRPCRRDAASLSKLYNVTGPEGDDGFSGWMRYETAFTADPGAYALDLGQVGECAHVWLNGHDLGQRIDAPYVFDITGAVKAGENSLLVVVTNSLVHQQPDVFSRYVPIGPSGLLGPVRLLYAADRAVNIDN
ncbi:MAG: glycosyl transferase family 2 [Clostridia bacterium]|nr:glycosyl transferase family 2 [Clostridia bacterium]